MLTTSQLMTASNPKVCERCFAMYDLEFNYYLLLGGIHMNVQMNLERKLNSAARRNNFPKNRHRVIVIVFIFSLDFGQIYTLQPNLNKMIPNVSQTQLSKTF